MTCNMQIDCTKTHSRKADKAAGKSGKKTVGSKSGGKDIEKQANASSLMSVEGGGGAQQVPGPRVTDVA